MSITQDEVRMGNVHGFVSQGAEFELYLKHTKKALEGFT